MQKCLLGIDVRDLEYASKIQYMINQMKGCEYAVVCYDELNSQPQVQYWISDGIHLESILQMQKPAILMADESEAIRIHWNGERMDPYLPVKKMMKQIRLCINNIERESQIWVDAKSVSQVLQEETVSYVGEQKGRILSVYSPIGGCGKTTMAITMGECLAELRPKQRTLYFNLEGTSDWPVYFRSKGEFTLSDFLYSMLLEKPDINTAGKYIEDITLRQESGVFFLEPCNVFEDLTVLDESEVQYLMDILIQHFDYIICDLNSAFHSINHYFMRYSHTRFLLSNGTLQGQSKMAKFKDAIRQLQLEQEILGSGTCFIQVGNPGRSRNKNQEMQMLPLQKDLYIEKNGLLCIRHNTEWYKKVRGVAEGVLSYARA